jgi:uncharacterized protein (DUF305 family)
MRDLRSPASQIIHLERASSQLFLPSLASHRTAGSVLPSAVAALSLLLVGMAGTACSSATAGPAAGRMHASTTAMDTIPSPAADPDVRFMRHMIAHHAQALMMTSLVPSRTEDPRMRTLAERIHLSQEDEISRMQAWLARSGAEPADAASHAGHSDHHPPGHHHPDGEQGVDEHSGMPGMLSPGQMAALEAASGPGFDRLFLELMIQHHEGALVMVEELFASEGAAQDPQVFHLASEVDADQRAEIARMRQMLETIGPAGGGTDRPKP